MNINDSDAIYLRDCAVKAFVAHNAWQVTNEKIRMLVDRINLVEYEEDEPFIAAMKPVDADIEAKLHELNFRRHQFAQEERSAFIAMKDKIFELMPLGTVVSDEAGVTRE